jgi:hypothetical protein
VTNFIHLGTSPVAGITRAQVEYLRQMESWAGRCRTSHLGLGGSRKNAATRLIAVINSLRDRRFFYQIDSHLDGSLRIYPNIDAPRHVVVSNMPEGAHGLQNPPMPRRISFYSGGAFPNSGLTIPIGGGV